ncbi:recombinase family protein [Streptococcus anginosus]|uniref:Resolvase, N-terminal domain protein n=1 Tax=Peptostreptococcus anaerobius 653-L TaxID=596329 RepID=D3MRM7_9FIRM|nr:MULTISPECIES: recombinase family protein [Bacillota]EFD05223.1 resolvase, N-terminal domain protein [Peptostreptococcus anaerobius 653-L]KAA9228817.1 recombinase [Streptococcus anginosus]MDB8661192.1 recombinase family protein [Streptococcus anginosus]MDU4568185.1 recombinase family protein [Streptococcus anginosus]MDU4575174.1 recombinase family protein [Streptococcus anginosus]
MARTSKRYIQKAEDSTEKVFYKAGIYTRLSSERKEEWREKSSSIETQLLCCKEYALKENIKVLNTYTDYEYSGTNFERPQFQEMMQDIRERRINCIIIRDLSRLGREYLEMGRLIDKVFPFLGVRFISVNDKVDTVKDLDSKKSFEVTLKNIVNDMYAKDISVKIKTSKHNRARNGYFIGSVPPYGYKVVKLKEGQKLEVDENVRFIIEEMFRLTLEGKSQYEVAKHFNTKGYATGMVYYKTGRIYRQDGDPQWNKATISKMLTNRAYTGTLVQGVKQQNLAKGMKQQFVDESQYIVYENAHEPIISKEDFEKVLQGRADRLKNNAFGAEMHNFERDYENRYKGLIFNNATGKELYRRTRIYGINHDRLYYSFQNDTFTGKIDNEVRVFIMERDLDKAMSEKVAEFITKATSKAKLIERVSTRFSESIGKLNEDISKLKTKTQKEELLIQKAYEEYSLGKIDREVYSLKREIALSHIATINNEVISIEKVVKDLERDKRISIKWIKDVFSAKKDEKLPADLIHSLVEKIIVHGNHNFEIIFKFSMDSLMGGVKDE